MSLTTPPPPHGLEIPMDDIDAILKQARTKPLAEKDCETLHEVAQSYCTLLDELKDKNASLKRLRAMVFGAQTETKANLLGEGRSESAESAKAKTKKPVKPKGKKKGHGRIPAADYTGARKVKVRHESLSAGKGCPHCEKGKVYGKPPRCLVRIKGCAPLVATVYEQERLRCNLCGDVFTAEAPEGVGDKKYDETAASMVGLLRYGHGFPMNRIAGLQRSLGVPLPSSTQWELVRDAAKLLQPALDELIEQAAQGKVLYNDDTTMKILDYLVAKNRRAERGEDPLERTGIFTTGVVAELLHDRRVVLYFTGRRHAGENLQAILSKRASGLDPPIQMCDGLDRNIPAEMPTIVSNCLVHARRQHADVLDSFPVEVGHVLEELALVYKNESKAKEMSPDDRLRFHQETSGPVMERLKVWMEELFDEKKVEPNSGLGKAMNYFLKRWEKLTLFLRVPGAPIHNNLTERMLKRAILHRKGSLFYKTENGARVGDLYMSLIATARLAKVDPFDYLNELQRRAEDVKANPSAWMPWNYRETLAAQAAAS